ncbi:MAG: adenylosuccinate lyase [Thermoplasmata archaeon]|nr:MAG: adenylosuccinate lyase [Thermoplasmata archaeon]
MAVCPLDYRYGREVMRRIFSEEGRIERMLRVEAALAIAHARVGNIPKSYANIIAERANLDNVKVERIKEIEAEIKHDVMALVKALSEVCGEAGKYVHLGATSNDIIDTATALQIKEAMQILRKDLVMLLQTMIGMAERYRGTIMLGRTHGQAAIPITFGLKMAVYASEFLRHLQRLDEALPRIITGKMSGAVGTGASFGSKALEVQRAVMEELGLAEEMASTQIVGRDRYIELVCLIANMATSVEKVGTEIRNLQRTEISEVMEAFDIEKQVGSSTMAHKKNPILAENICGLCRVIRGFITPMMECGILWHERDLTNSSAERFIIPHVLILIDDVLTKLNKLLSNLVVFEDRMRENVRAAGDIIMAEAAIMALVEKGLGRQEAHEIVRRCAMRAQDTGTSLLRALMEQEVVTSVMEKEELETILRPENYLGVKDEIIDSVIKCVKEYCGM